MDYLEKLEYHDLLDHIFTHYTKRFTEKKFKTIFEKINASVILMDFLDYSLKNQYIPVATDFILSVNKNPYFLFSKQITTVTAAIIALHKWNLKVNQTFFLIPDHRLAKIAVEILKSSNMYDYLNYLPNKNYHEES